MRDLVDDPTWEDDLTGIGPEEGDPANGEEVSTIGDRLASRTRYLKGAADQLLDTYVMIDHVFGQLETDGEIAEITSESALTLQSIASAVVLAEGDIVEAHSEYHYSVNSEDSILISHDLLVPPSTRVLSITRRLSGNVADVKQVALTSTWIAEAGNAGAVASVRVRAWRTGLASGYTGIAGPNIRTLKIWRQVTL